MIGLLRQLHVHAAQRGDGLRKEFFHEMPLLEVTAIRIAPGLHDKAEILDGLAAGVTKRRPPGAGCSAG